MKRFKIVPEKHNPPFHMSELINVNKENNEIE